MGEGRGGCSAGLAWRSCCCRCSSCEGYKEREGEGEGETGRFDSWGEKSWRSWRPR